MSRTPQFYEAMRAYDNGDTRTALHLMEECASNGDPVACFTVALWYSGEDGVPTDKARSNQWLAELERLAEDGSVEAQWELGQHYRFGNVLAQSTERANSWLERAAEGGYGEAQHHLAWYFETGQYGYPIDANAAEAWYRRAFEQEHPETLYRFALKQFQHGRPSDEAIRLLKKAADKGLRQAKDVLVSYTH